MIIRPGTDFPIKVARASLFALSVFHIYQTPADYALDHNGVEPPPPDPLFRAKSWYDPAYAGMTEDDGNTVSYLTVHRDPRTGKPLLGANGRVKVGPMVMSTYLAGRVNLLRGLTANEFPLDTPIMKFTGYPFPIRELHADEELRAPSTPFGDVEVVNVRLLEVDRDQKDGFTEKDRVILQNIEHMLVELLVSRLPADK